MAPTSPSLSKPIRGVDDLLLPFHEAQKPAERWCVGTEIERFGLLLPEGRPLPYEGERSVVALIDALIRNEGWEPLRESADGPVVALVKGRCSLTLEPGGQLELSGAPLRTIHETRAELVDHAQEIRRYSEPMQIAWLGVGFHPLATPEQLPWVPKIRYRVMRDYLPQRGSMALDMMRRTCTVQANLDYADEADAMRKLRVSLALQPLVTAIFANSPWFEGKTSEERSRRALVWLHVDPTRTGLLAFAWEKDASYLDYVEWALDVPMFLLLREGRLIANTGQTFRDFMSDGFQGARATQADWEMHLNTLFPEVRLKRTLEMRGADGQRLELACALPALWKGLMYEEQALSRAESLAEQIEFDALDASRPEIARDGLRATLQGRELRAWAAELLEIARGGLSRLAHRNESGQDESIYLREITSMVERGLSPADQLLLCTRTQAPDARVLLDPLLKCAAFG